ncbi:MAG TPA: AMP-binding protein [Alphaproteobacteria bacterium]|nr:AMP-binding protein [Alphaproteobacteria bacterium]
MFWTRVRQWPDRVAMREKEFGIWQEVTWRAFGERVQEVAFALDALGFGRGDVGCILSNTNKEWVFADLGILCLGGVATGVYPTDAAAQVEYLVNNCQARLIFVEDDEQLDKVLSVRERCPSLQKIVIFDMEGLRDFSDPMAISFDELLALGRGRLATDAHAWEEMLGRARPQDLAVLVYTSGTTGPPKGAMISHHNVVFQCVNGCHLLDQTMGDERLLFLPLCHVAERVGGEYYALYTGTVMNFVEGPDTVPENVRELQPTILLAVPRIWEKFYSAIQIALKDATPLERWAYARAIGIGYRVADRRLEGRSVDPLLRLRFRLAYWLVLKNIRKMIGIDRCRRLVTGAAPISPQLIRWFLALGLDMLEVYGQTENTGLATAMMPDEIKLGTVGRSVPYGEVKISPQGEILLRGEHIFMGYYNMPEKTAETIVDGWLHTGDVGAIDNEGFVKITDRMKDIIITAGGKNITPSELENELKFSPYISDAVVIGDGHKYLTALIMIDQENVEKYAQDHDVPFTNFASLTRAREVVELIAAEVEEVNRKFARVETVKKFRLIEHLLDPEDEELTPTMKLKRSFVNKKYAGLIESMYRDAAA